MEHVYVLKLKNNKWYVGKTENIGKRLSSHFKGHAALWTRKHPPISIELVCTGGSYMEKAITIIYANKYGVENVRGYCFCQREFTEAQIGYFNNHLAEYYNEPFIVYEHIPHPTLHEIPCRNFPCAYEGYAHEPSLIENLGDYLERRHCASRLWRCLPQSLACNV